MNKLVLFLIGLLIIISGCRSMIGNVDATVKRYHDDELNVTCWVYAAAYRGGIDCIPDWQLKNPEEE